MAALVVRLAHHFFLEASRRDVQNRLRRLYQDEQTVGRRPHICPTIHYQSVLTGLAPEGAQQLVQQNPHRFFVPPYVGVRGWLGVRLDRDVDWDEIAELVTDPNLCVAPRKLRAKVGGGGEISGTMI